MLESLLPSYDAIYVVSDLHLGGFTGSYNGKPRNYRIFREGAALSTLFKQLSQDTRNICLVLNGDIVDFLAEEKAAYFDWTGALAKLKRIMSDPDQVAVWNGLRDYVATGKDLVLVLGNHDVELALPEPQLYLLNHLTTRDRARRASVHFAMDGAGFGCMIGKSRVLCLHGNEADPWNAIDYGRLSLIRRALARNSVVRNDVALTGWIPNAGTQMVIEYMNSVKRKHQWVDLLKPEEEAAGMVTAALAPLPGLRTLIDVTTRRVQAKKKLKDGWLGGGGEAPQQPENAIALSLPLDASRMLNNAAEHLARDVDPADLVPADQDGYLMGVTDIVRSAQIWSGARKLRDVLREALAGNCAFQPDTEDATFEELDELCGPDIDFIVAGHTHLHRALKRKRQAGYYYNSGTWIRLLQIPEQALGDQTYPELERLLEAGDLAELENGVKGLSLLRTTRSVVCIAKTPDGSVRGELLTVEPNGDSWKLTPVLGTVLPAPEAK